MCLPRRCLHREFRESGGKPLPALPDLKKTLSVRGHVSPDIVGSDSVPVGCVLVDRTTPTSPKTTQDLFRDGCGIGLDTCARVNLFPENETTLIPFLELYRVGPNSVQGAGLFPPP